MTTVRTGTLIDVSDVSKRFGAVEALSHVSFSVRAGEVVGLLGPNGAGKTTLVRTIATLLAPDTGTVTIDGVDVVRDPDRARRRIGLAGQLAALDELLTGRENLELVGRLYGLTTGACKERAAALLDRFGLALAADRRVATYSGGMRRRLDLGATLIGEPSVLLLDEPTTGLDPKSRNELWDIIDRVAAVGTTVLLTSQYLEELDRLASRIVVLDEGRVIADGDASTLKQRVGRNVVEARLATSADLATAAEVLTVVSGSEAQLDRVVRRVTAPSTRNTDVLVAAANGLAAAGVEPVELGFRLPSLDDVFFSLTGTPAHEVPTDEPIEMAGEADTELSHGPPPAHRRRHGAGADIATLTWRYGLRMLRTPQLLFFSTIQPVLFVVGLSAVFGPLVERILGERYIQYLLPGALVMNLILTAGSTGVALADDMKAGIIDRFRSLPMARSAVLTGRTIADLVRNAGAVVFMLVAGFALGYRLHAPVLDAIAALGVTLLFAYAFTWLFAALGLAVKDPQTAQFATFAPVLPLVYLSGAWVPITTMQSEVQGFARHQPVNVTIDAARSLAAGVPDHSAIVQSIAWSLGMLAVFVTLAVRQYQRAA